VNVLMLEFKIVASFGLLRVFAGLLMITQYFLRFNDWLAIVVWLVLFRAPVPVRPVRD